jgi:nitrogen fixation protein FixH
MPYLEPHPQNGQRKLLLFFGTIVAVLVIIAIIASIFAGK